jgi:hypothetical protein
MSVQHVWEEQRPPSLCLPWRLCAEPARAGVGRSEGRRRFKVWGPRTCGRRDAQAALAIGTQQPALQGRGVLLPQSLSLRDPRKRDLFV